MASFSTEATRLLSSETFYDEAGRVFRTVTGRAPVSSVLSETSVANALPATYPARAGNFDRYADLNLTSGTISDILFDDRGRQDGTLGHPLPASEIGFDTTVIATDIPDGVDPDTLLVRIRTETTYDSYSRTDIQRTNLAHVETPDGTFVGVYDAQSVDVRPFYDAFGNVYRSEYLTGGQIVYNPETGRTERVGGASETFTRTEFDDENRPIAEQQQTETAVDTIYDPTQNSFVVNQVLDAANTNYQVGDLVPTKTYHYDSDDRLEAVELAAVPDPNNGDTLVRPRYEYGYSERGSQTEILDPLGRDTRFAFTDRVQQSSRTLPLGFGEDGVQGTADDASAAAFTERFEYDDRNRRVLHVSFEGIHRESVYDSFGRIVTCRIKIADLAELSV